MDQSQFKEIRQEFHYIRNDLNKVWYELATHNTLLREHEARSLALQELVKLEKQARESMGKEISKELEPIKRSTHISQLVMTGLGSVLVFALGRAILHFIGIGG